MERNGGGKSGDVSAKCRPDAWRTLGGRLSPVPLQVPQRSSTSTLHIRSTPTSHHARTTNLAACTTMGHGPSWAPTPDVPPYHVFPAWQQPTTTGKLTAGLSRCAGTGA